MEFIAHRINTLKKLQGIPAKYGIEIDLRDCSNRLILQHEPFREGEDFENYLKYYRHGTLILNIKSEGIEIKVLELIKKYSIKKYFFLDCSFPMIYKLLRKGEKNIAVRFSELERADTVLALRNKLRWVWIDCFTKLPLTDENYELLKGAGFKLCLVSPELQGREGDIEKYKKSLKNKKIILDAICTKIHNIEKWNGKNEK